MNTPKTAGDICPGRLPRSWREGTVAPVRSGRRFREPRTMDSHVGILRVSVSVVMRQAAVSHCICLFDAQLRPNTTATVDILQDSGSQCLQYDIGRLEVSTNDVSR